MDIIYKLTEDGKTKGDTEWRAGVRHDLDSCSYPRLCTGDVLHGYRDLDLGLLLHPIHACFDKIRAFECQGPVVVEEWDKLGCFTMKVVREIPLPGWYQDPEKRVRVQAAFASLCVDAHVDRTALATVNAARAAAGAAAYAACRVGARNVGAQHAVRAAAACAAADRAYADRDAAYAAIDRANADCNAGRDFIALAKQAIEIVEKGEV